MTYIFRRPSWGEIAGTSQEKRRLSRHAHLHALDPEYQARLAERRTKRRMGYYKFPFRVLRFALRLLK